jgi:hypothetical protein
MDVVGKIKTAITHVQAAKRIMEELDPDRTADVHVRIDDLLGELSVELGIAMRGDDWV